MRVKASRLHITYQISNILQYGRVTLLDEQFSGNEYTLCTITD